MKSEVLRLTELLSPQRHEKNLADDLNDPCKHSTYFTVGANFQNFQRIRREEGCGNSSFDRMFELLSKLRRSAAVFMEAVVTRSLYVVNKKIHCLMLSSEKHSGIIHRELAEAIMAHGKKKSRHGASLVSYLAL